jgi:hypothetical protein
VAAEILSSKFAERLKARINAKQEPPINWSFDYEEYLNGRVTRVGQFDKNSTIRNPFSVPKMELGAIVRLLVLLRQACGASKTRPHGGRERGFRAGRGGTGECRRVVRA